MNEIVAFIGAAAHLTTVAKALLQTHTKAEQDAVKLELNSALLELQGKISDIQIRYQHLLETNESLKQRIATYERWEQESSRYSLQEIVPGILAYGIKPGFDGGEPKHWLCATCYQERQKSILHLEAKNSDVWICPRGHPPLITEERG